MKDHIVYTTHHGDGEPHTLKWVRFAGLKEGELFLMSLDIRGVCVKLPNMVTDEANDVRYGNYLRWRPSDVVEIGHLSPKQEVLRIYDPCLHGNLDLYMSGYRSTDVVGKTF